MRVRILTRCAECQVLTISYIWIGLGIVVGYVNGWVGQSIALQQAYSGIVQQLCLGISNVRGQLILFPFANLPDHNPTVMNKVRKSALGTI